MGRFGRSQGAVGGPIPPLKGEGPTRERRAWGHLAVGNGRDPPAEFTNGPAFGRVR